MSLWHINDYSSFPLTEMNAVLMQPFFVFTHSFVLFVLFVGGSRKSDSVCGYTIYGDSTCQWVCQVFELPWSHFSLWPHRGSNSWRSWTMAETDTIKMPKGGILLHYGGQCMHVQPFSLLLPAIHISPKFPLLVHIYNYAYGHRGSWGQ